MGIDLTKLKKPFSILAPMDEVSDTVFRQVVASLSPPDLFISEFTNVDGLISPGRDKVRLKLDHPKRDKPVIAQLWGLNPDNFKSISQQIVKGEFGQFVGVDLNMGCPVKEVVRNGACSGLMNNRPLAEEIIKKTKEGLRGKLPLSVKTRIGFNLVDLSWPEFLLKQNIDMLIIHGRTKKEMSKVPANWEVIGEISRLRDKISPSTLIVGNGDLSSLEEGRKLADKYNLDGFMIGRGIFSDPFVFAEDSPWPSTSPAEKIRLYKRHAELFKSTWGSKKPAVILNKFCKIYISNFDGAKEIREEMMAARDIDDLLRLIDENLKQ